VRAPDKDDRQRRLLRLKQAAPRLHAAIERVSGETAVMLRVELARPLTSDEAARARSLRLESEALRGELAVLRTEFEQLRRDPRRRTD
jgi:hypothetical protein